MYSPDAIEMPPRRAGDLEDKMERLRVYSHLMGLDRTSEQELRQAVAMYYGMIRYLDDAHRRKSSRLSTRPVSRTTRS